jgi:PKD repeat protein
MGEQTFIKMKKKLAIFLIVSFVLSITAVTASAAPNGVKEVDTSKGVKLPSGAIPKPTQQIAYMIVAGGITAKPSSGNPPLKVTFSADVSSDVGFSSKGYSWDFGDGSKKGTGKNPKHTYRYPGTYTVTLDVTDNKGSTSHLETTVTVNGLMVDFTTTNSRSGYAPYDVDFEPKVSSSTTISSYEWDFGDGTQDFSEVPPPHTYDTPGDYDVSLTVTDDNGITAMENKPNFIHIK